MAKTEKRKPKSDIDAALHEMASGLYNAGIMDRKTMRDFDETCLSPVRDLSGREIKSIRLREKASQSVFAVHLNVRADTVAAWEQSKTRPDGAAMKLLNLIDAKGLSHIA